jgi:hypothetical protein
VRPNSEHARRAAACAGPASRCCFVQRFSCSASLASPWLPGMGTEGHSTLLRAVRSRRRTLSLPRSTAASGLRCAGRRALQPSASLGGAPRQAAAFERALLRGVSLQRLAAATRCLKSLWTVGLDGCAFAGDGRGTRGTRGPAAASQASEGQIRTVERMLVRRRRSVVERLMSGRHGSLACRSEHTSAQSTRPPCPCLVVAMREAATAPFV